MTDDNNEKIKKIYEKYENEMKELEEKYKEKKNNKRKFRIRYFTLIFIIVLLIFSPLVILGISFGINELGWFDNHKGMYKTELPIELPARGQSRSRPWRLLQERRRLIP